MTEPIIDINNIKVFTQNNKHEGDYFLITEDNLTFWVTDPHGLLSEKNEMISSLKCGFKVVADNGKNCQQLEIKEIGWYVGTDTKTIVENKSLPRPDYSKMTDEQIAADILERRKLKEQREGNSFVKFRDAVVKSQIERHRELIKSIKYAQRKGVRTPEFEDIEIDPDYMRTLVKEQHQLEARLGRETMIGDGQSRLDGSPNYDMNNDLSWGTPKTV